MKKVSLLLVIIMAGIIAAAGCKKAEKAPEAPGEEPAAKVSSKDAASPEVISERLSASLCKRMIECAQGVMTEEECITQTKNSLTEALKEKPLNITMAMLDACINDINTVDCQTVMGTKPPPNCGFLGD